MVDFAKIFLIVGAGGAGYQSSWGMATNAADLVQSAMESGHRNSGFP